MVQSALGRTSEVWRVDKCRSIPSPGIQGIAGHKLASVRAWLVSGAWRECDVQYHASLALSDVLAALSPDGRRRRQAQRAKSGDERDWKFPPNNPSGVDCGWRAARACGCGPEAQSGVVIRFRRASHARQKDLPQLRHDQRDEVTMSFPLPSRPSCRDYRGCARHRSSDSSQPCHSGFASGDDRPGLTGIDSSSSRRGRNGGRGKCTGVADRCDRRRWNDCAGQRG